ncbi:UTP--glucose-1-phosphate uridylyltransferase [Marinitenerispora sediminis]|uniref:UTP--glucose-1-phosphate uridylyltransferase n=1 Tax=Marinitenerispora sediminis TaxID=1931232 RepID=A0A368SZX1_9ACTN|nr:UTP--glucose-1-phosphate uridylyltransferase [Marinitenerispora sediminis]RCV51829.1 nucleotidyltransferase [Marinitenerispora sediminis]RCV54282.1 nucleotidyltransferase [Marinitenerispora sediminis]RCV56430.1 nucleotidyltransferase [Marinitenerispora sediminis]
MTRIRKAVIPVAGLGTRLLPLTKALPKEMLPILDKPVLQHTIEELVASGIEDITIVTSSRKALIQQHFAPDEDLDLRLRADGKADLAEVLRDVVSQARITYLYQDGPYGNGTPVLNAARVVGAEPFMVLWADDVFTSAVPRARQLLDAHERAGAPVLGLMAMEPAESRRYGVPVVREDLGSGLLRIGGIVEKPQPEDAPSGYASIGGYVVTPGVVTELERQVQRGRVDPKGEVYLSAAIHEVALREPVFGQVIDGTWWDTGNPLGYLRAQFAAALAHPVYGPELRRMARETPETEGGTETRPVP